LLLTPRVDSLVSLPVVILVSLTFVSDSFYMDRDFDSDWCFRALETALDFLLMSQSLTSVRDVISYFTKRMCLNEH